MEKKSESKVKGNYEILRTHTSFHYTVTATFSFFCLLSQVSDPLDGLKTFFHSDIGSRFKAQVWLKESINASLSVVRTRLASMARGMPEVSCNDTESASQSTS